MCIFFSERSTTSALRATTTSLLHVLAAIVPASFLSCIHSSNVFSNFFGQPTTLAGLRLAGAGHPSVPANLVDTEPIHFFLCNTFPCADSVSPSMTVFYFSHTSKGLNPFISSPATTRVSSSPLVS
ncbi:uncharacterized protein AKAW2_70625S [Aspergillus luchuensis]|uniref:Uncharacterized protein n=1 Tax=Aspergillus kawachii TaxID=1069201 RepID=A0A7R8A3K5_ASPKA|nr:uncharacterized protein AKAW2_70625S [Aspergillus luchuensis]BCS03747.1 hypothetical protein AKAW2_70625S [Aspergillus luchuensis]